MEGRTIDQQQGRYVCLNSGNVSSEMIFLALCTKWMTQNLTICVSQRCSLKKNVVLRSKYIFTISHAFDIAFLKYFIVVFYFLLFPFTLTFILRTPYGVYMAIPLQLTLPILLASREMTGWAVSFRHLSTLPSSTTLAIHQAIHHNPKVGTMKGLANREPSADQCR